MTNNFERGDRAEEIMAQYYGGPPTGAISTETDAFKGYPMGDLIADLCHLAQRNDVPVDRIIGSGVAHFGADVIEQAWEHDDGSSERWNPELQNEENIEPA